MSTTLTCISTGSVGNSFILDCNGEKLILELGVRWKDILSALDYRLDNAVGCLLSHRHVDHIKSVPNALSYGLPAYSSADVASIYPKVKVVEPMKKYSIGGFMVTALPMEHNVECYGYVIDHPDMGRLCFYTDTRSFNFKIPHVNFVLGEVNYSDNVILDNLCDGYDVRSQYDNHMSLDTAISVIHRLYSPELSKVICCHLSDSNADENEIKRRFKSELGMEVEIAEGGKIFSLESCEF